VSDGDRQTSENQRPELECLAAARGYDLVQVFDEACSAAKARPGYDAMLKAAHAGEFDVLLVWSLDRFGRSMVGNLQAVLELDRIGVKVVSCRSRGSTLADPCARCPGCELRSKSARRRRKRTPRRNSSVASGATIPMQV